MCVCVPHCSSEHTSPHIAGMPIGQNTGTRAGGGLRKEPHRKRVAGELLKLQYEQNETPKTAVVTITWGTRTWGAITRGAITRGTITWGTIIMGHYNLGG